MWLLWCIGWQSSKELLWLFSYNSSKYHVIIYQSNYNTQKWNCVCNNYLQKCYFPLNVWYEKSRKLTDSIINVKKFSLIVQWYEIKFHYTSFFYFHSLYHFMKKKFTESFVMESLHWFIWFVVSENIFFNVSKDYQRTKFFTSIFGTVDLCCNISIILNLKSQCMWNNNDNNPPTAATVHRH